MRSHFSLNNSNNNAASLPVLTKDILPVRNISTHGVHLIELYNNFIAMKVQHSYNSSTNGRIILVFTRQESNSRLLH